MSTPFDAERDAGVDAGVDAAFNSAVDSLIGDKPPQVWSLLITVFGEMAQGGSDEISGVMLSQLVQMMRIKPEANRVALHRLRKDGWIDSRKHGRNSHYALTARGRAEVTAASPRIYGTDPMAEAAWLWLTGPDPLPPDDRDACTMIAAEVGVADRPSRASTVFCASIATGDAVPDWIKDRLCSAPLLALAARVRLGFERVAAIELEATRLDPKQVAVLRVLIVHAWRRVVLRTPLLPDYVLPDALKLGDMRDMKSQLLAKLPPITPNVLRG